jgi:hypothetical protein
MRNLPSAAGLHDRCSGRQRFGRRGLHDCCCARAGSVASGFTVAAAGDTASPRISRSSRLAARGPSPLGFTIAASGGSGSFAADFTIAAVGRAGSVAANLTTPPQGRFVRLGRRDRHGRRPPSFAAGYSTAAVGGSGSPVFGIMVLLWFSSAGQRDEALIADATSQAQ